MWVLDPIYFLPLHLPAVCHIQCGVVITPSTNFHKMHPIARPLAWGRGMRCPLWDQTVVYTLPQSLLWYMQYHVILDRVITALGCITNRGKTRHDFMKLVQWKAARQDTESNIWWHQSRDSISQPNCSRDQLSLGRLIPGLDLVTGRFSHHEMEPFSVLLANNSYSMMMPGGAIKTGKIGSLSNDTMP